MKKIETLLTKINKQHKSLLSSERKTFEVAKELGSLLSEVKSLLPHGKFMSWIKQNTKISIRSATEYMKIHKNYNSIIEECGSNVSIAAAIKTVTNSSISFPSSQFGSKLKSLRKKSFLKLKELAKSTSMTIGNLASLESGRSTPPDILTVYELCKKLKLDKKETENMQKTAVSERKELVYSDYKDSLLFSLLKVWPETSDAKKRKAVNILIS